MTEETRDRSAMEGLIAKADVILRCALDPDRMGLPKDLCEQCKGILILSVIEAGFIVTVNVGCGILLAKRSDGTWSGPSAVEVTGIGWGFVGGGSIKDIVIFLMDQGTLKALAEDAGLKLGVQAEFTLANCGRSFSGSVNFSNSAIGRTMSIAYSKGCFGGISIEGALIRTRKAVNEAYYTRSATCFEIIAGVVDTPDGTKIDDIYIKLNMLKKGKKADEHREG